ncbi:unnamed protein product [Penicillium camemberti]|uniref:Str. FM013 n=1 Tax=Penicillium camemberti (strain FM 013) TaxID=1429867 RepID=A0A0G4P9Q7_PENC3|nr:unnamed protein product [Penicillium camemberti]
MASHSNYAYSFFCISKTHGIGLSVQRSRDLRLKAFKASPSSFASTYEVEYVFTDAEWVDRITIPDRKVFICVATPLPHDGPRFSRLSSRMGMNIFCERIGTRPWTGRSGSIMVSCISCS